MIHSPRAIALLTHSMYSYFGFCPTQKDSFILFEAARRGLVPTVKERLSDKERMQIQSGAVYIWSESDSGIKRWTDGLSWSNSRVAGPFLEYRQLESRPPYEGDGSGPGYQIKNFGLCKRTICRQLGGENTKIHLINYYTKGDVRAGRLHVPSQDPRFSSIVCEIEKREPSPEPQLQDKVYPVPMAFPPGQQIVPRSGAPTPPPSNGLAPVALPSPIKAQSPPLGWYSKPLTPELPEPLPLMRAERTMEDKLILSRLDRASFTSGI